MPAPKNPNTTEATKARRRIGDRAAAQRLTEAGWIVYPPDDPYQAAVDWLINKQYPEDEARFRALAQGLINEDEAHTLTDTEISERLAEEAQ